MSPVRVDGAFPKPFAGGSSPKSTNFPDRISSTRERFKAGTPGVTTTVSVGFELLLPPDGIGRLARSDPPTAVLGSPVDDNSVEVRRGDCVSAEPPVGAVAWLKPIGKLLSPRLARVPLEGIAPSATPILA